MAEITKRIVETVFTATDKGVSSMLNMIGMGADQTTSKLLGADQALAGMLKTTMDYAKGYIAVGAMKGLASSIMDVGQKAEQANISLAGMLQGQGIAADFNTGLTMARDTLAKIEKDAAALPGEAQEFQMAFQTAAGSIKTSGLGLQEFTGLTNKLVATGKIFGEDAAQAGRDISLLIEGRAGMDVLLWSKLSTYMGYTVSDAQKFNKLKPDERMAKLFSVVGKGEGDMGKLGSMIQAYGSTWDSISSTITSAMDVLWRTGSAPLFEKAKKNAELIANWLGEHEAELKTIATGVGNTVANVLTPSAVVGLAGGVLGKVAFGFGPVGMAISSFAAKSVIGTKSIDELGKMALSAAEKISPFIDKVAEMASFLYEKLGPAFDSLFNAVTDASVEAFTALAQVLVDNVDIIVWGIETLASGLSWIADKINKISNGGATNYGNATKGTADYLFGSGEHGILATGVAGMASGAMLGLSYVSDTVDEEYKKIGGKGEAVKAKIQKKKDAEAAEAAQAALTAKYYSDSDAYISNAMSQFEEMGKAGVWEGPGENGAIYMANKLARNAALAGGSGGSMAEVDEFNKLNPQGVVDAYAEVLNITLAEAIDRNMSDPTLYSDSLIAYLAEREAKQGEQANKNKPKINQDFRHSRFDIRQQFPDGVDPDRVAVAFRHDLESLGNRKLQSGITGAIMGMP